MFAHRAGRSIALATALALGLGLAPARATTRTSLPDMALPARAACRNSTRRSATACSSIPIRPISHRPPRRRSTSRPHGSISTTIQLHDRGPRGRTRHARIQFRPRRARAQAVHDYLVAKGVSASRMRTISYGKERPVASCDDISCWSQNRRAVTVLNGAPEQLSAPMETGGARL